MCSCTGYCKYNSINGTNFGDYGFIPLQPLDIITDKGINTAKQRVIVDLRWPNGKSVNNKVCNNSYMGSVFKLKFPTVDEITERVQK